MHIVGFNVDHYFFKLVFPASYKLDDFVKSQNCDGKVIPPGRDQIQGARILCHTANAVPEGCVLSVRRNDNEMKRNAVPLKRDLRSHQA